MKKSVKTHPIHDRNSYGMGLQNNAFTSYRDTGEDQNMDWIYYTAPQVMNPHCKCKKVPLNRQFNRPITKFLLKSLAKSSISGVNSIVSVKNPLQKFIWTVVFVCCLSGFSYQTFNFMTLYNMKPSVVQIEVENDGLADFPSVTLCNTNRVRRSEFCKLFPNRCENNPNLTLSENEIGDMMFGLMLVGKFEEKKLLGHSSNIVQSCIFNGEPRVGEEECRKNLIYSYDPDYGNCYTIPSVLKNGHNLEAREADFWQEVNDLSILVDIETDEAMERKRYPGIIVTIHGKNFKPELHTDAITIGPGNTYQFAIARSTVYLLPLPYKTNCTNYEELPWDDDPKVKLTSRLCTVGCSQYHQSRECNNVVTRNLSLFFEKLPYDLREVTPERVDCATDVEMRTQEHCRSICGLPCMDTTFEVSEVDTELTERELFDHHLVSNTDRNWTEKMKNLALVRVYFSTLEHKIFRHTPKYNTMELFSYLGGYSGVWLGFSLLTVYELIEIICTSVLFAINKHQRIINQKKFISSIFKQRKKAKKNGKVWKKKTYR